ncbi:hypothetical protein [Jannaschia ovalis]|uniref:Uncharacterized protein n=1 Tax=Jannaschia ovalis TaxID=3038773 RepID=A0ABY8LE59_9RHOB|nr:hypothetical protein [Jannaschia sp. GRR-S6-38]WGH79599.1 hypothetical protein P8627_04870 [Jannaschia sp. GRR-S6-38]
MEPELAAREPAFRIRDDMLGRAADVVGTGGRSGRAVGSPGEGEFRMDPREEAARQAGAEG